MTDDISVNVWINPLAFTAVDHAGKDEVITPERVLEFLCTPGDSHDLAALIERYKRNTAVAYLESGEYDAAIENVEKTVAMSSAVRDRVRPRSSGVLAARQRRRCRELGNQGKGGEHLTIR